ncbi:MAG: AAA family ATPase, partial [Desulfamplus sp.]|nr:AAA family ATPase [Desulfamplus sp.]
MERFFNTAGPTKREKHYHIPLLQRVDWDEIKILIKQERYFVLHAPRQTGKTSTLLAIMEEINKSDQYISVYSNIEGAQAARNNVERGMAEVARAIASDAEFYLDDFLVKNILKEISDEQVKPEGLISELLMRWSKKSKLPIVLLLDEVDALVGDTLISLLRQLRAGYTKRPKGFPLSIILCGVRDVRDYRITQESGEVITGGSAFNIKAESLRMGNFSEDETRQLILQHTKETGQIFDEGIFPNLWEDTKGQPWLVNALGHQMTWKDKSARNRNIKIDINRYFAARERLIQSRATHLDQLADKLKEERVSRIISAVLSCDDEIAKSIEGVNPDDQQYVIDLGLITKSPWLKLSNRIYQEIIPRELTWVMQSRILPDDDGKWYIKDDNSLDMKKLIVAFQQFFRENSEIWIERFDYKEAGPQLLMQAFLQRVINGGGRL